MEAVVTYYRDRAIPYHALKDGEAIAIVGDTLEVCA